MDVCMLHIAKAIPYTIYRNMCVCVPRLEIRNSSTDCIALFHFLVHTHKLSPNDDECAMLLHCNADAELLFCLTQCTPRTFHSESSRCAAYADDPSPWHPFSGVLGTILSILHARSGSVPKTLHCECVRFQLYGEPKASGSLSLTLTLFS